MDPLPVDHNHSPLSAGLLLVQRNKRLLLWAYLVNLLTGLTMGLTAHAQYASVLDHSLAAQRIAGRLDLGYLLELMQQTSKGHADTAVLFPWLAVIYVGLSFVLAAGMYMVFSSGERPTLAYVARSGIEYFWRFIRLALFAALFAVPTLGILLALRQAILKQADKIYVERTFFCISMGTFLVVLLVAIFLRLWFDLAEAIVIQMGKQEDRRVRRCIFPAWRILCQRCFYNYAIYFFVGALGWAGFIFFLWFWTVAVPPRMVVLAWLVGQFGILSLLKARIWQRGMVTAIVASASMPVLQRETPSGPPVTSGAKAPEETVDRAAESSGMMGPPANGETGPSKQ